MFPVNTIGKFSLLFSAYLLISFIVSNAIAFTIIGAIAYIFIIGPIYLAFVLYLLLTTLKHRQHRPRYRWKWLKIAVVAQVVMLLASPSSCFGSKQGRACYSFLQAQLTNDNLQTIANAPAHWTFIEVLFPIAALIHLITIGLFLSKLLPRQSK
ncbi:hypothetical protein IQ266_19485 [filamentous cyanobacterium LEGE 11480]|uniref:Uncharacterized protein n=1 Tax=Romeriopsis navalis LEGE 11480 TaxID=2777977 RepID=A0A928Z5E9_9CYAN|nr:hypothetical protein [Romeriopsis navalis]MBE9031922.1 hypothetical protein [Romeriopsis navalis LEGE 11480]